MVGWCVFQGSPSPLGRGSFPPPLPLSGSRVLCSGERTPSVLRTAPPTRGSKIFRVSTHRLLQRGCQSAGKASALRSPSPLGRRTGGRALSQPPMPSCRSHCPDQAKHPLRRFAAAPPQGGASFLVPTAKRTPSAYARHRAKLSSSSPPAPKGRGTGAGLCPNKTPLLRYLSFRRVYQQLPDWTASTGLLSA